MRNKSHEANTAVAFLATLALVAPVFGESAHPVEPKTLDIRPQSVSSALRTFAEQTGMQLIFTESDIGSAATAGVSGNLSPHDALAALLRGTGLQFEITANNVIVVRRPQPLSQVQGVGGDAPSIDSGAAVNAQPSLSRADQADENEAASEDPGRPDADEEEVEAVQMPEILVRGSRSLNGDIRRTSDDIQPYVVFSAKSIERSQASNVEEFLRMRLPMNTEMRPLSQSDSRLGDTRSSINLRGLGQNQTLILVDGRRMPGVARYGGFEQPDINGIPIAAVERIEVLPSSASGIYGGSATGGVVNVILKRDYSGLEVGVNYGNTFDTIAGNRRVDLSGGLNFGGGNTRLSFAASHSDSQPLQAGDRDLAARSRALRMANDPLAFINEGIPLSSTTPNIRSANGSDLVLKDGTPLNSPVTFVPIGYTGGDGGAALVANAGHYNLEFPDDLRGTRATLLNAPTVNSVSATLRHEFTENFEAYLDTALLKNYGRAYSSVLPVRVLLPATAPNNPFTQRISVSFPTQGVSYTSNTESETLHSVAGAIARLPHEWSVNASYGWDRSRYQSKFIYGIDAAGFRSLSTGLPPPAPDTRPALDVLSGVQLDFAPYLSGAAGSDINGPNDSVLKIGQLRLSGPIFKLPGGSTVLSALLERRDEIARSAFAVQRSGIADDTIRYVFQPEQSQAVNSAYLEANAPIVSALNARPWLQNLELQASIRRDAYATHAAQGIDLPLVVPDRTPPPEDQLVRSTNDISSVDYTVGFRAAPIDDLTLRASYGTGFLPPAVSQIVPTSFLYDFGDEYAVDPKRGGDSPGASPVGIVPFTLLSDGNPALKPETSRSLSVGLILTPRFAPGLRLSVDYTKIKKANEITFINADFLLAHEDSFPGRVVRGPNLPGDDPSWAGPVIELNDTLVNLATSTVKAYDFQLEYTRRTERLGSFNLFSVATMQKELRQKPLPDGETFERVGVAGGPLKLSGSAGLAWSDGPWGASWNMQYFNSYCLKEECEFAPLQGSAKIPSVTYHDILLSYQIGEENAFKISLGVQNVFNQIPPILAEDRTAFPGGSYSPYGADPRLRRFSLTLRKTFGSSGR